MARWKFQLCPNQRDAFGNGFRLDAVGEAFEERVNDAMPFPLGFHGVNKIVIRLGPPGHAGIKDYGEVLGVGEKQYPNFSYQHYMAASPPEREALLEAVTRDVFRWLVDAHADARFVAKAAGKLGWTDLASLDSA